MSDSNFCRVQAGEFLESLLGFPSADCGTEACRAKLLGRTWG